MSTFLWDPTGLHYCCKQLFCFFCDCVMSVVIHVSAAMSIGMTCCETVYNIFEGNVIGIVVWQISCEKMKAVFEGKVIIGFRVWQICCEKVKKSF